jgi:hypothetical protein
MKNLLILTLLIIGATGAWAGELAGVNMPDSVQVGEDSLALNGMGLRKKAIIKVYVAGLYLDEPSSEPENILASDSARMTRMNFRYGVKAGQMCDGWTEGLENNTPGASTEVVQQFETLCGYMEDMEKNEEMVYTYQPGKGTTVEVKGSVKGTIEGKPFADALWGSWIGPEPPSTAFREGLLGRAK